MWLTTEEHPKFPAVLLETCFKVSFETPPGLRKSMERIYYSFSQTQFQKFSTKKSQLVFILSYFSSLIQERRTYIPQGWSKYYEFSPGDFKAGVMLLDSIIQSGSNEADWNALYGLMENAIYGGRIDNAYDVKVLRAYLRTIFNDETLRNKTIDDKYEIPQSNSIKDHLKSLNLFPELNHPSYFGLPIVMEIAVQRFNTEYTFGIIRSLESISEENMKFDREKFSEKLEPFISMWKKVYAKFCQEQILNTKFNEQQLSSNKDPIENFIMSEQNARIDIIKKINELFTG